MDPVTPFKASNGVTVDAITDDRDLAFGAVVTRGSEPFIDQLTISARRADALREFFRAEEDEGLGRWRWPENPDYVVYDRSDGYARVLRERDGTSEVYIREDIAELGWCETALAARAFFDAHPVPKPAWHDAKAGEAWLLTVNGEELIALRDVDEDFYSTAAGYRVIRYNRDDITAGRRIWPEEVSS